MTSVGNLRNSFGRTDKAEYIFKRFKHRLRVIPRQRTFITRDPTGYFQLDSADYGVLDENQMLGTVEDADGLRYKYNDSNTFIETFESSTFMDTVDWTFNRSANTITVTTNDVIIDKIVEDQATYQQAYISIETDNTDLTGLDFYIVTDDLTEHPIATDGTLITFTPSTTLGLTIKNTGSGFTTTMFNDIGKPMIMSIIYS